MFPFHLSSTIFADPECWNVICDDNSVYQFTRKVKALPGGALFKYDNGCSVFLSYNFFSILKESNITQSRLSLDMFRAVTEKFFIEYHQDLSAIPPLQIPWYSFAVTLCPTKILSIMSAVKSKGLVK